jgi:hypothetical protein
MRAMLFAMRENGAVLLDFSTIYAVFICVPLSCATPSRLL